METEKQMSFEQAMEQLELVLQRMDRGDLPLEEALEVYKYGIELSKLCVGKLNTVKQEVEKLVVENEEEYTTEPFKDLEA